MPGSETSIRRGVRGSRVEAFQRFLIAQGHLAAVDERGRSNADGVAGLHTVQAIRSFQEQHGIRSNLGIAGPVTLAKAREFGWVDGQGPDVARDATSPAPSVAAGACYIPLEALRAAFPKLSGTELAAMTQEGQRWFVYADLDNVARKACFLANVSHESGGGANFREAGWLSPLKALRYFVKEYAARSSIFPRDALPEAREVLSAAERQPADETRHDAAAAKVIDRLYVGRAALQVTHRANYAKLEPVLGRDFVAEPRLLESPGWALAASVVWWRTNHANRWADGATSADSPAFKRVCNLVNRGNAAARANPHGWEDRRAAFRRILPHLVVTPPAAEPPAVEITVAPAAPIIVVPTAAGPASGAVLARGARGAAVEDLQLQLAGFRGTLWDGEFGPGTELQVVTFQRDVMGMPSPSGVVDAETRAALRRFAVAHPIDFARLRCPCGTCGGFGQDRFAGEYQPGMPATEAYHRREYPGIHRAILHALRAATFYAARAGHGLPLLTSGYRCWVHNQTKGRTSTNHMGKALDCDLPLLAGEDKRDDQRRCDAVRGLLVEVGNFQIGWDAANRKSLEPSHIAPTWVHMDVRSYDGRYLADRFYVRSAEELDTPLS